MSSAQLRRSRDERLDLTWFVYVNGRLTVSRSGISDVASLLASQPGAFEVTLSRRGGEMKGWVSYDPATPELYSAPVQPGDWPMLLERMADRYDRGELGSLESLK